MQEQPASEERLHPAAIVVWAIEGIQVIVVALVIGLARGGGENLAIAGVIGGLGFLSAVVRYVRFRYALTEEGLVLTGGVLNRWRKVLPRARIQSVDVVRKLRHRLFGVVELRVEVIGGRRGAEGALVALRPQEAQRLRADLIRDVEHDPAEVAQRPLVELGVGELVLAGATGGRVAVIAAMLAYLDELLPESAELGGFVERWAATPALIALVLVGAVLVVSVLVSLFATVLVYWRFTVRLDGDRLVITRGLLEERRSAVPLHRIQAFVIEENIVRRIFGLASVRMRVAGYVGGGAEEEQTSMLLPIGKRADAWNLVSALVGASTPLEQAHLEPAPARALSRRIARAIVVAVAVTSVGVAIDPAGAWAGVILLPAVAIAFASWRSLGHVVSAGIVAARSGVAVRRCTVMRVANVQVIRSKAGPAQRLAHLRTLELHAPKARARAYDLAEARAEERFQTLVAASHE